MSGAASGKSATGSGAGTEGRARTDLRGGRERYTFGSAIARRRTARRARLPNSPVR